MTRPYQVVISGLYKPLSLVFNGLSEASGFSNFIIDKMMTQRSNWVTKNAACASNSVSLVLYWWNDVKERLQGSTGHCLGHSYSYLLGTIEYLGLDKDASLSFIAFLILVGYTKVSDLLVSKKLSAEVNWFLVHAGQFLAGTNHSSRCISGGHSSQQWNIQWRRRLPEERTGHHRQC